jgi:hypothetical protein
MNQSVSLSESAPRPTINPMRLALIVFIFALSPGAAYAQGAPPRREDPLQSKLQSARQLEMIEAALMRRSASSTDRNAALAQIRQDFWRIQLANDDLTGSLSKPGTIDSHLIAKTAAEIRTRAKRLKENLALPGPVKESKLPADVAGDLRSSIASLSKLIDSFVNNPMLSQRHVVDANLSVTAGRDLEYIIILSGEIRKSAARLK